MARKNYTDEFRRQAVDLYRSTPGATLRGIAADLGISRHTLHEWVRAQTAPASTTGAATSGATAGAVSHPGRTGGPGRRRGLSPEDELAALRARVAALQTQNDKLVGSFNATLKRELLQGAHAWPDEATCRRQVFGWVNRYNTRRRHTYCGQQAPIVYEQQHTATLRLAG